MALIAKEAHTLNFAYYRIPKEFDNEAITFHLQLLDFQCETYHKELSKKFQELSSLGQTG